MVTKNCYQGFLKVDWALVL